MENQVRQYLDNDKSGTPPNIDAVARALILLFYRRSERSRTFAQLLLALVILTVFLAMLAVLNAGWLEQWDISYARATRTAFVEDIPKELMQLQTDAKELAISTLRQTNWIRVQGAIDFAVQLHGIHMADYRNGWAVGSRGTILAAKMNGRIWVRQESNTSRKLLDVHFAGSKTGWVVGFGGTILVTKDGGEMWSPQVSGTPAFLHGIYFTDSRVGWTVGQHGTVLATNNGGETWSPQSSGISQELHGVHFTDSQTGWIVGRGGTILATKDGGQNWSRQVISVAHDLHDVHFVDSLTGWAVGDRGTILVTRNGGKDWNTQVAGISTYLSGVCFVDASRGWVVGDNGTILVTKNGGETWISQDSDTFHDLDGIGVIESQAAISESGEDNTSLTKWVVGVGTILFNDETVISSLISGIQEAQRPSEILELIRSESLDYALRQNDVLQRIDLAEARYQQLEELVREMPPDDPGGAPIRPPGSPLENFLGRYTIIRFAFMSFSAFLLQLLVSLYRYNMRLAAYYDARGDALFLATQAKNGLHTLTDIFSPDNVDYGRSPSVSTKNIVEVVKSLTQRIDSTKRP